MLIANLNFKMSMTADSNEIDEKIRHFILEKLEGTLLYV